MATLLTLVRHGQSRENAAGRWQGRSDGPLTAAGRRQMQALAERLVARGTYAAIYTSPLGRALESARLLAPRLGGVPVYTEAGLAEYDFGVWDGLTPAELLARGFWEAVSRDPTFAPPGGEPFAEAVARVVGVLRRIAVERGGERAVIMSHGLVLAATLGQLLDGDSRAAARYTLDNAGMAELALDGGVAVRHLDPPVS
jgi:broad specificity phosphatase PhoE